MNKKSQKATISDVAEAAGVSLATVSRAINQKNVKKATYDRIIKAMAEVGYDTDKLKSSSKLILVAVPDINNPFYTEVIKGISSSAGRHGYQEIMLRTESHMASYEYFHDMIQKTNVEGLITLDPIISTDIIEKLSKEIPLVQCSEYTENSNVSYVSVDDFAASKAATQYIISKGKKNIALINGPNAYKYARNRQKGFIAALEEEGLKCNSNFVVQLPVFGYDAAFSIATQLLSMEERPDAIFAVSDVFAVAAIKAAKKLGLRVPEDIGVVGFDNTDISIISEPSMTTVKQPQFQMGFLAGEMLLEKINNTDVPPKQIMLDVEIIVRESI